MDNSYIAGREATLAALLRQDGSPYDPAGLQALVAGVAAAPPGADETAWMALVAPRVSRALEAELRSLVEAQRAAPAAALGTAERLTQLRAELARRGVQGFLVPRADEHQGEYVPSCAQRLA